MTTHRTKGISQPNADVHISDGVRLQKVLASAGYGSRRACEDLIAAGNVTVNGQRVRELGIRVDPATAVLHVDGRRVQLRTDLVTLAINKPAGVVTTMSDPYERPTVFELVKHRVERVFHVGRLDADTEGLLLMTNDGDLANRLMHPSYGVMKTYRATVAGRITPATVAELRDGIMLSDGPVKIDALRIIDRIPGQSLVEVVLHEGRNRIVRRTFESVGHPVTRLVRTQIGPVRLGHLRPGESRVLSRDELGALMSVVGM